MGALPKRRISTHRKGRRRQGHIVAMPTLVVCRDCGGLKRPHTMCAHCQSTRPTKPASPHQRVDRAK